MAMDGTRLRRNDGGIPEGFPAMTVGRLTHAGIDQHRTPKTSERVAIEIVNDVVARGLRTGDHLPLEADMVKEYGASRASVREALRLLEVQGLIRLKPGPGGGPVVGTVEPANLARTTSLYFHLGAGTYDQLLRTQALLEPVCAQLAARHPDRDVALRPFLVQGEPRTERDYRRQADDFHEVIYRLAGNAVLSLITQAMTHMVTDHVLASMDPLELRPAIVREHALLARAIAGGQAEAAGRLMAEHFRAQHAYYRQHWPERLRELIEWR